MRKLGILRTIKYGTGRKQSGLTPGLIVDAILIICLTESFTTECAESDLNTAFRVGEQIIPTLLPNNYLMNIQYGRMPPNFLSAQSSYTQHGMFGLRRSELRVPNELLNFATTRRLFFGRKASVPQRSYSGKEDGQDIRTTEYPLDSLVLISITISYNTTP